MSNILTKFIEQHDDLGSYLSINIGDVLALQNHGYSIEEIFGAFEDKGILEYHLELISPHHTVDPKYAKIYTWYVVHKLSLIGQPAIFLILSNIDILKNLYRLSGKRGWRCDPKSDLIAIVFILSNIHYITGTQKPNRMIGSLCNIVTQVTPSPIHFDPVCIKFCLDRAIEIFHTYGVEISDSVIERIKEVERKYDIEISFNGCDLSYYGL